ncbi:hypothetical protein CERZMDRAFT_87730 [Cercospora zeae-maydis SCOH1-5]|uniref:Uncharacterized protein n=1 Tax=Cercospora zeae-maydis SCOH1-5 TaxID=717836 RepID=A0A6A6F539_9PEZI|nr:hypothetical protein CERZMDRAFT_87730 [Cercospora zeae-maydis SCOH1-5]
MCKAFILGQVRPPVRPSVGSVQSALLQQQQQQQQERAVTSTACCEADGTSSQAGSGFPVILRSQRCSSALLAHVRSEAEWTTRFRDEGGRRYCTQYSGSKANTSRSDGSQMLSRWCLLAALAGASFVRHRTEVRVQEEEEEEEQQQQQQRSFWISSHHGKLHVFCRDTAAATTTTTHDGGSSEGGFGDDIHDETRRPQESDRDRDREDRTGQDWTGLDWTGLDESSGRDALLLASSLPVAHHHHQSAASACASGASQLATSHHRPDVLCTPPNAAPRAWGGCAAGTTVSPIIVQLRQTGYGGGGGELCGRPLPGDACEGSRGE